MVRRCVVELFSLLSRQAEFIVLLVYEFVVGSSDVPPGNMGYASESLVFCSYLRREESA